MFLDMIMKYFFPENPKFRSQFEVQKTLWIVDNKIVPWPMSNRTIGKYVMLDIYVDDSEIPKAKISGYPNSEEFVCTELFNHPDILLPNEEYITCADRVYNEV